MTYVETIEPRLTPLRPVAPLDVTAVLAEWCRDLEEELGARLRLMSAEDVTWQAHPHANSAGVTVWHVARWLDVLATRTFTRRPARDDLWHTQGWRDLTGYEPDGIGYLGLGTLTGYTPQEMQAVPVMGADALGVYLAQATAALIERIGVLDSAMHKSAGPAPSPYQIISGTVQGSFGHIGEIDTLVALRARLKE